MAHSIAAECINCVDCEPVRPVDAIGERGDVRVIDPDLCADCDASVDTCPVNAIEGSVTRNCMR